jgi:hypothetical protein
MGFSVGSINECLLSFIYMFDYNSKTKNSYFILLLNLNMLRTLVLKYVNHAHTCIVSYRME